MCIYVHVCVLGEVEYFFLYNRVSIKKESWLFRMLVLNLDTLSNRKYVALIVWWENQILRYLLLNVIILLSLAAVSNLGFWLFWTSGVSNSIWKNTNLGLVLCFSIRVGSFVSSINIYWNTTMDQVIR